MPAILALLSAVIRTGLSYAKWIGGQIKVEFFRLAIQAKKVLAILAYFVTKRAVFWAACFVSYQVALAAIAFFIVRPISSSLISVLLPSNSWAEGLFYMVWDSGISLSYAFSLLLVYWGNKLACYRIVDVFAEALSYRIVLWQDSRQLSLGLMSSSK